MKIGVNKYDLNKVGGGMHFCPVFDDYNPRIVN